MIDYTCCKCGNGLQSPDSVAGEREKCPECGTMVIVPTKETVGVWKRRVANVIRSAIVTVKGDGRPSCGTGKIVSPQNVTGLWRRRIGKVIRITVGTTIGIALAMAIWVGVFAYLFREPTPQLEWFDMGIVRTANPYMPVVRAIRLHNRGGNKCPIKRVTVNSDRHCVPYEDATCSTKAAYIDAGGNVYVVFDGTEDPKTVEVINDNGTVTIPK